MTEALLFIGAVLVFAWMLSVEMRLDALGAVAEWRNKGDGVPKAPDYRLRP